MEALSSKEREFAAENHGLIYSFLNYYRLTEAEHYDICAIAYLQAVKEWHRKPELRDKYKFSTIAFKKMESAKIKKYHADRLRDAYIIFSLNDLNAEGNEYLGQLADQRDVIREIEAKQNIKDLLSEVMPALTERQRKHLVRMAEGETPIEIMRGGGTSITDFWKDRKRIRQEVAAAIGREERGGVFDTWTSGLLLSGWRTCGNIVKA